MNIQVISFEEILPIWRQLWEGRKSPIEPVSAMVYLGGYDISIMTTYTPTFFGVYDSENLIAVNSGVRTAPDFYRSRGLYVLESHRRQGLATRLLERAIKQAKEESCSLVWSIPRIDAFSTYKKAGFIQTSLWFDNGMEFGPNCYVKKLLHV